MIISKKHTRHPFFGNGAIQNIEVEETSWINGLSEKWSTQDWIGRAKFTKQRWDYVASTLMQRHAVSPTLYERHVSTGKIGVLT